MNANLVQLNVINEIRVEWNCGLGEINGTVFDSAYAWLILYVCSLPYFVLKRPGRLLLSQPMYSELVALFIKFHSGTHPSP